MSKSLRDPGRLGPGAVEFAQSYFSSNYFSFNLAMKLKFPAITSVFRSLSLFQLVFWH